MTITRSVDQKKQLTTITMTGELSFEKMMSAIKPFFDEHPTKNVLWDFRKATLTPLSSADVENIVNWVKKRAEIRKGGKTVWVVSKAVDFGVIRMMSSHGELKQVPFDLKVYYSMEEATQWLKEDE
jgi:hypothetical protein